MSIRYVHPHEAEAVNRGDMLPEDATVVVTCGQLKTATSSRQPPHPHRKLSLRRRIALLVQWCAQKITP